MRFTVHPHVRGVYGALRRRKKLRCGPSPRAWGLPAKGRARQSCTRSIPTCVGFTRRFRPLVGRFSGPSPRAWGLLAVRLSSGGLPWSIPTCVGFTNPCADRVRFAFGPSPRAWGLLLRFGVDRLRQRSIPTCVGFTRHLPFSPSRLSVHPHVRGVYSALVACGSGGGGPSPRAWGLRRPATIRTQYPRSIPTCVGFTYPSPRRHRGHPVHPHVRGVYVWLK